MKREHPRRKLVIPKIRPISRTTISDEITEQIMALIAKGELQPGQRLPSERDLCVRFGIGRSSLREALRCLSIVGVLQARVGNGTSVAPDGGKFLEKVLHWRMLTERHNVENMMEVRIALEGLTVGNVALNRTPEDLITLHSLLNKMKTALQDHNRFLALDVQFHLALAKASGNSLALDLITMVRGHLAKTLGSALKGPNARPLSLKEHAAIVRRIEEGDVNGARDSMHAHLISALERYRQSVAHNSTLPTKSPMKVTRRPKGIHPSRAVRPKVGKF